MASAQVSAAQLAAARLSAQAQLATDYFQLRFADSLKHLLEETVKAFQRSLEITENQYTAGTAARSDVINAQAQLLAAQPAQRSTWVSNGHKTNTPSLYLSANRPPKFRFHRPPYRTVFLSCRPVSPQLCLNGDRISLKPSDRCRRRTR